MTKTKIISQTGVMFHEINQKASPKTLAQLSGVGDTLEQMAWKCGWLVNQLYLEVVANGSQVTYLDVCYYVSVVSLRGQRSHNTVKRWALTARFFPEKVAKQLGFDLLPMSHFTYAASFDDQVDEQGQLMWKKVLDHSWQYTYSKGKGNKLPPRHLSVEDLKAEFEGKAPQVRSMLPPSRNLSQPVTYMSLVTTPFMTRMDQNQEEDVYQLAEQAIAQFERVLNGILPTLQKLQPRVAQGLAGILTLLRQVKPMLEKVPVKNPVDS